jgi:hypothetical protein
MMLAGKLQVIIAMVLGLVIVLPLAGARTPATEASSRPMAVRWKLAPPVPGGVSHTTRRQATGSAGTIVYVDAEAVGANTGLSWTDAFTEVQSALAVAGTGDQVWVAEGIYYPDYSPEQGMYTRWVTATFDLPDGVILYGGFDPGSGAGTLAERDSVAHATVLSGDLDRNDAADSRGVVTDTANIAGDNAWTVVSGSGEGDTVALDGFVITAGNANGATDDCWWNDPCRSGGGMHNLDATLTITDVVFSANQAVNGGAVSNRGAMAITACTIGPGNNVSWAGGGIFNDGVMTITHSTITGNSGTGSEGGAGIVNYEVLSLINSTISGNETNVAGGGILATDGTLTLNHCTVTGNTADLDGDGTGGGGGIYYEYGPVEVKNTIIAGNGLGPASTASGPDLYGDFISLGYNLIGKGHGSTGFVDGLNGDQVGSAALPIDPLLGALTLNPPGSTATHALLEGSPARDRIPYDVNGCGSEVTTDQRLMGRPVPAAGACDIGAYEASPIIYLPLTLRSTP